MDNAHAHGGRSARFEFTYKYFAIFKNVAHSFEPGETPSNVAHSLEPVETPSNVQRS